jgi:CubicO group peptidase (beta-lactamase class C family)
MSVGMLLVQNDAMIRDPSRLPRLLALFAAALVVAARSQGQPSLPGATATSAAASVAEIDKIFDRWNSTSLPGCTVGVSEDGRPLVSRAYGMADLEHGIANQPDSIIEAGSVSKQFTAAAVLLLVQQGRLALDDPARKHLPELPDYGTPLTVRHMLTHTSGLRDWGSIEGIVGWPRTRRAYTHAHVLDIVARQRSLNFPPGSAYSYSNTGYNLAAVLVSRVAGKSFADFTREALFEPLGMTRTSWRDDFTRVVRDRAIAYAVSPEGVSIDMPFENVHGNGGLLTTVGDLLKWNENALHAKVGGRALVELQREPMRLVSGQPIEYAFGLRIASWKGVPEVSHAGATAGYRAWLAQYPTRQQLSVAVLCNAGNAPAADLGHQVAELFLDPKPAEAPVDAAVKLDEAELLALAGLYRDRRRNDVILLEHQGGELRVAGRGTLTPLAKDAFRLGTAGARLEIDRDTKGAVGGARVLAGEEVIGFDRVDRAHPPAAELLAYAGEYTSDEAELSLRVAVEDGRLVIHRRPDTTIPLTATYSDGFTSSLGGIRFVRNPKGIVTELSVSQDRVWDLRLSRVPPALRR